MQISLEDDARQNSLSLETNIQTTNLVLNDRPTMNKKVKNAALVAKPNSSIDDNLWMITLDRFTQSHTRAL